MLITRCCTSILIMIGLLLCTFNDIRRVLKNEKSTVNLSTLISVNPTLVYPSSILPLYKHLIICHRITDVYGYNVNSVEFYPSVNFW